MRTVFADTVYWVSLVNPRDAFHHDTIATAKQLGDHRIVTSEMVLVEVLNFLSAHGTALRQAAVDLVYAIAGAQGVELVPQDSQLFREALTLYRDRPDKQWSLTDCASFLIMEQRGLTEALTLDQHFEQYGFRALLRS
jgi:predicted nucleic acid-binding protein